MKKTISLLLAICILMSVMSLSAFAANNEAKASKSYKEILSRVRFESTCSGGKIKTADARAVLKAAAGISTDSRFYDMNGDGAVSLKDAQDALRVASNIEPAVTKTELINIFNQKLNSVKSKNMNIRPDFRKESTVVCPSILVTTTGAPLFMSYLNVKNMEYRDYIALMDKRMGPLIVGNPEMQAEMEKMRQSAKEAYEPHYKSKNVYGTNNTFNQEFPVYNYEWVSKLTSSDVKSISCRFVNGSYVFTVKMGNYTYAGYQYPLGDRNMDARQKLPYGHIFSMPDFVDQTDPTKEVGTLNEIIFSNGVVTLNLDENGTSPESVSYSYRCVADITAPAQEKMVMTMRTTTDLEENFTLTYNA